MAEVRIKNVNDALWRSIKILAVKRGTTVTKLVLGLLEKEARKEK